MEPHEPHADLDAPRALPALDPRSILIFREVGRTGSLTGAAQVLGWTQPAVSQHVRRLEAAAGVPLLAREGRGVVVTDAGRALLRHADALAAALHDAEHELADHAHLRAGRVRIASFPSASATIAARAVSDLAERFPGIDLRLEQLEPPEALRALEEGACDIAIVFEYDDGHVSVPVDADRTPLAVDPLQIILPPGHPLTARAEIRLDDLADEQWVTGCISCRRHLLTSTSAAGFTPDIRHSTDDYVVVQALVATRMAVAVLPSLAVRASRNPDVTVHPLADHAPRRVSAITRRSARSVPSVGAALAAIQRAAHALNAP